VVFEPKFGFTLRERKSRTLDQIQIDALEVEANFTSIGKWKRKTEYGDRRRGMRKPTLRAMGRKPKNKSLRRWIS